MQRPPNEFHRAILAALEAGPLATPKLSHALGEGLSAIRARCRQLEEEGLVTSTLAQSERRQLYFPSTGEVLTYKNHDRIMRMAEEDPGAVLKSFYPKVRVWELTGAGSLPGDVMLPPPRKRKSAGPSSLPADATIPPTREGSQRRRR